MLAGRLEVTRKAFFLRLHLPVFQDRPTDSPSEKPALVLDPTKLRDDGLPLGIYLILAEMTCLTFGVAGERMNG
jgi:hypothetical protein